jgi:hypothetical protein
MALMRAKDVLRCPVRSLAELFLVRFVHGNEAYPDPASREQW